MPGLIGHDIRSILFFQPLPQRIFFALKTRKIPNFSRATGNTAASLYNPTGVTRRYK
jgi:hypothetical protein